MVGNAEMTNHHLFFGDRISDSEKNVKEIVKSLENLKLPAKKKCYKEAWFRSMGHISEVVVEIFRLAVITIITRRVL